MNQLQNCKHDYLVLPQAIKNNGSWTSNYADGKGFSWAHILIRVGATDIALSALKLQHSDTSDGNGLTDIAGCDFSVSPATLPSATDDNHAFLVDVDLRGKKRYLYLVATEGNGSTGGFLIAEVLFGKGDIEPNTVTLKNVTQALRG